MREIDKILNSNEKVLWEGRPKFWPYFLTGIIPMLLFGLGWTLLVIPFVIIPFLPQENVWGEGSGVFIIIWTVFLTPFVLISFWMLVGIHIYKWLVFKYLHYVITDKRMIIQKGIIGRDFEYVDFDQITNAEVNVGFWDKMIGQNSGSISVSSGVLYIERGHGQIAKSYTISNIDDPYEVFKFFKKVSHDVKTDIEYPNKLRPTENPGYLANYNPEKK